MAGVIANLKQVKSAKDLLIYTKMVGIPTDIESVCTMQDIIGHTAEDKLIELANDNDTQKQMMPLLYVIWNWEDATRFYNNHVNPLLKKERKEYAMMKVEIKEAMRELEATRKALDRYTERGDQFAEEVVKEKNRADEAEKKLKDAEQEILKLKAMLFDYMTK